jgi:hypothetical protein
MFVSVVGSTETTTNPIRAELASRDILEKLRQRTAVDCSGQYGRRLRQGDGYLCVYEREREQQLSTNETSGLTSSWPLLKEHKSCLEHKLDFQNYSLCVKQRTVSRDKRMSGLSFSADVNCIARTQLLTQ